jgi:hypothetical protein
MKRLLAALAVAGLIASPALATTKGADTQTQAPTKGKDAKAAKKAAKAAAKANKAAPSTSKSSN